MICETKEYNELSPDYRQHIDQFFSELIALCKKYDVSISHQDTQGGFVIESYGKDNIEWITQASYRISSGRTTQVITFINNQWHQMDEFEPQTLCGLQVNNHHIVRYNSTEATCEKCQRIMRKNEA